MPLSILENAKIVAQQRVNYLKTKSQKQLNRVFYFVLLSVLLKFNHMNHYQTMVIGL